MMTPVKGVLAIGFALALLAIPGTATNADTGAKPFPDVSLLTLDGQGSVPLTNFRGRPVLLTFWASWCGPCRVELPELEKLYGELAGDGFVLLTINVDTAPQIAPRFLASIGVDVPVYRMSRTDLVALNINALPTNILLDPEGVAIMFSTGYEPSVPDEIRRLVRGLQEEADVSAGPTEE